MIKHTNKIHSIKLLKIFQFVGKVQDKPHKETKVKNFL
jgi:hypothetical protein